MNALGRPITILKSLAIIFLFSIITACGNNFFSFGDSPHIDSLSLMPESKFKPGGILIAKAFCSHCDNSKTQYRWMIEGEDTQISTESSLRIPLKHSHKEISLTATAVNTEGNEGSSLERRYALNRVKKIVSTQLAFAALKTDGSVVTWGNPDFGGDSSDAINELNNKTIISIASTVGACAALKSDGSVVTWGGLIMGVTVQP